MTRSPGLVVVGLALAFLVAPAAGLAGPPARDGRRDFDFSHGRWKAHIRPAQAAAVRIEHSTRID